MANKFLDLIGGVIKLRLKGENKERIMNMALSRGIYIWDIKWHGEALHLRVRTSGFKALQTIADENGYEIELLSKRGWPFYKSILKRRSGFLGGAAIFLLTLYLLSSFIWFIELSGNKKLDAERILTTAARYGIYKGAAQWDFSPNEVEEAMLKDLPQLSYVQCEVHGVKATIKVVEKILPDEEMNRPCHIVAAKDGVIEEILVLDGQANVEPGQVVGKGDILISGIVFPTSPDVENQEVPAPTVQPYPVRAQGTVKARIWYEGYGECPLKIENKVSTGRTNTALFLQTPWKKICLSSSPPQKKSLYRVEMKRWTLPVGSGNWAVYKRSWHEQVIKLREYSEAEAIEIARERAIKKLRQQMQNDMEICDSQLEILSSPSDSIVRIKVSIESIEDISVVQPIKGAEISN